MDEPQPKTRESDADALLKQLDMEMELNRASRGSRPDNRQTVRVLSVLFVVVFILGLLGALYFFTKQIPNPTKPTEQPVLDQGQQ